MREIKLTVYTPVGKRFEDTCDFVQIHGNKYFLGILPNHAPLISDVVISKMIIRIDGNDLVCAVGDGVVSIENNTVKVVVYSFEKADEIDVQRAKLSKERAEERLANPNEEIDVVRAKASLARALNRLTVAGEILE